MAKKPSKKSSSPVGAVFMDFERDGLEYDIDALARRAVLKQPAVQKRIDKVNDCPLKEAACRWLTPA